MLGRLLSEVECPEDLYPSLRGLQLIYEELHHKKRGWVQEVQDHAQLDLILTSQHMSHTTSLQPALQLLSGRRIAELESETLYNLCAHSASGICASLGVLYEISDDSQEVSMTHIAPGNIEYNEKPFYFIEEQSTSSQYETFDEEGDMYQPLGEDEEGHDPLGQDEKDNYKRMGDKNQMNNILIKVRATSLSLSLCYEQWTEMASSLVSLSYRRPSSTEHIWRVLSCIASTPTLPIAKMTL